MPEPKKRTGAKPVPDAEAGASALGSSPASHLQEAPTPPPAAARGAYKEHLKPVFLEHFRKIGTQYGAAQVAQVDYKTVTRWRETDPEFNDQFMQVDFEAGGRVETSFYQRAVNGDVEYARDGNGDVRRDAKNNPVVLSRKFSDAAQIFFLKCRMPDRYAEKVKQELDIRIVHTLASEVLSLIRKHVPDFCPHCKTALAITPRLASDLAAVASRLAPAKEAA